MTPQSNVDAVHEIIAEMLYLLGVEEDFAYSATTPSDSPIEGSSE